jgi:hypothetical protein
MRLRRFWKGETKGHLDFPKARQGGFAGGLFAIFVPSTDRVPSAHRSNAAKEAETELASFVAVRVGARPDHPILGRWQAIFAAMRKRLSCSLFTPGMNTAPGPRAGPDR